MAPIFNLNSEALFWGVNSLLGVIIWILIGYYYARTTYERFFELDVDGFDGYRHRDLLLFPAMSLNYLGNDKEATARIFTQREWPYIITIMLLWPIKLLSCIFWWFVVAGSYSYMLNPDQDKHPRFPLDF